jgi:dTDP-4-amino-4,6-dideoxygalactose transaminase
MEPYRSFFPHAGLLLPETERVAAKVVVLPTGSAIGDNEISGICQVIRLATANGRLLRDQLSAGSKVAAAR